MAYYNIRLEAIGFGRILDLPYGAISNKISSKFSSTLTRFRKYATGDVVVRNGNNVHATFDIVEWIVKLVAFDNAWTLLLVWTELYITLSAIRGQVDYIYGLEILQVISEASVCPADVCCSLGPNFFQ